jgi:thymidine phosphorylase
VLLARSDLGVDEAEGRRRAEDAIARGGALAAYERWVQAQGGDPAESVLPRAPVVQEVLAPSPGTVATLGALGIGRAAMHLGAGRTKKGGAIDYATGIVCLTKIGDAVESGQPLAEIHARDGAQAEAAAEEVAACYTIAEEPVKPPPLVLEVIA